MKIFQVALLPNLRVTGALFAAASALAVQGAALPAPAQLHISADKIQVRQADGQVQYIGRVRIRHGELRISGNRALVKIDNRGEKTVMIWGKPVQVDFSKQDGSPIKLICEELTYGSQLRQLSARDSATLTSHEGTLSGGQLDYSLAAETFSMAGTTSQPRISAVLAVTTPEPAGPLSK
jgi:lipopolysaccharide export system protein LptA